MHAHFNAGGRRTVDPQCRRNFNLTTGCVAPNPRLSIGVKLILPLGRVSPSRSGRELLFSDGRGAIVCLARLRHVYAPCSYLLTAPVARAPAPARDLA